MRHSGKELREFTHAALAVAIVAALGGCDDTIPPMLHGPPNEHAEQMCVVCHTCGTDKTISAQAPTIDQQHDVCTACHAPDGGVIIHSEEGCEWKMDCTTNPPIVNCNECHTVEYVNDLCERCH